MGDMADMLIEQMWDMEEYWERYPGEFEESNSDYPPSGKRYRQCYHCGKSHLIWGFVNNSWRLFEDNKQHICNIQDIIRHKNVKSFLVPKLSNIPYLQWAAALKFYKVT